MKNLKYILILNLLIFTLSIKATPPDWSVNQANYSYNMTVTGVVNIDFEEITTSNNIIGAFVGEECRGVATTFYHSTVDRYVYYLMIYANTTNEVLTFKFYDAQNDEIIDITSTLNFQVNGIIGNAETPFVFANQILSSEAEILIFNISGQLENTISENEVEILMPYETDLTNLTATFTLSDFATAFIGIDEQESGTTANNFTESVEYKIIAQDGTVKSWTITVSISTTSDVKEFVDNKLLIYPNPAKDFINISCSEKITNVKIINILGQSFLEINSTQINISGFESGMYIFEIQTENNIYSKKILFNN